MGVNKKDENRKETLHESSESIPESEPQTDSSDADLRVLRGRRALIKAGWTFPVVMALSLPAAASTVSPAPDPENGNTPLKQDDGLDGFKFPDLPHLPWRRR